MKRNGETDRPSFRKEQGEALQRGAKQWKIITTR